MSATYFKKFLECEASAMNELNDPVEGESDALIQGNYLHTYFESKEAHEQYINEYHDKLYTNKGEKYAVTKKTDLMIKALDTDDFFHYIYQGEREVILDGKLYGYPWKARIDCLNVNAATLWISKPQESYTKDTVIFLMNTDMESLQMNITTRCKWEFIRNCYNRNTISHLKLISLLLISNQYRIKFR